MSSLGSVPPAPRLPRAGAAASSAGSGPRAQSARTAVRPQQAPYEAPLVPRGPSRALAPPRANWLMRAEHMVRFNERSLLNALIKAQVAGPPAEAEMARAAAASFQPRESQLGMEPCLRLLALARAHSLGVGRLMEWALAPRLPAELRRDVVATRKTRISEAIRDAHITQRTVHEIDVLKAFLERVTPPTHPIELADLAALSEACLHRCSGHHREFYARVWQLMSSGGDDGRKAYLSEIAQMLVRCAQLDIACGGERRDMAMGAIECLGSELTASTKMYLYEAARLRATHALEPFAGLCPELGPAVNARGEKRTRDAYEALLPALQALNDPGEAVRSGIAWAFCAGAVRFDLRAGLDDDTSALLFKIAHDSRCRAALLGVVLADPLTAARLVRQLFVYGHILRVPSSDRQLLVPAIQAMGQAVEGCLFNVDGADVVRFSNESIEGRRYVLQRTSSDGTVDDRVLGVALRRIGAPRVRYLAVDRPIHEAGRVIGFGTQPNPTTGDAEHLLLAEFSRSHKPTPYSVHKGRQIDFELLEDSGFYLERVGVVGNGDHRRYFVVTRRDPDLRFKYKWVDLAKIDLQRLPTDRVLCGVATTGGVSKALVRTPVKPTGITSYESPRRWRAPEAYRNDTTLCLEPIENVPPAFFYELPKENSQDKAFAFDVRELVVAIVDKAASYGEEDQRHAPVRSFVNPYNRQPFSLEAVRSLRHHPSGWGRHLAYLAWEFENR